MILSAAQSRRFERLRDALMSFVLNGQLGASANGEREWRERAEVFERILGPEGDPTIIDDFCAQNPAHLNRTDLREVESWKQGLYATFGVIKANRDIVFVCDDTAFCVRGIYHDVDYHDRLPLTCATALLPFDGLITYAGGYVLLPDIQLHRSDMLRDQIWACRRGHRLARNSREFLRLAAPLAKRLHREGSDRQQRLQALGVDTTDLGPRQHVGKLAGLSQEERKEVSKRRLADAISLVDDFLLKDYIERSLEGEPTTSFAEACLRMSDLELSDLALDVGIAPHTFFKGKKHVIGQVAKRSDELRDVLSERLLFAGKRQVQDARRMLAERDYYVCGESLEERKAMPHIQNPTVVRFYDGERFHTTMPRVVRTLLARVNWDRAEELAGAVDEAIRTIDCIVDFRGVVDTWDVIDEVIPLVTPELDADLVYDALKYRSLNGGLESVMHTDAEHDLLIHFSLEDLPGIGIPEDSDTTMSLSTLLEQQHVFLPRPIDAMGTGKGLLDWLHEQDVCKRLVRYLDAHVPDSANDYSFADIIVEDFEFNPRLEPDDTALIGHLEYRGFKIGDRQRETIEAYSDQMHDIMPLFCTNGWSLDDIREGRVQLRT